MITQIVPGDTVRVKSPEYKGRHFTALTIYFNLVEIEIGVFVEMALCQKKYKNRYIPIRINN